MRGFTRSLRGIIGHIEVDRYAVGLAVIRKDVIRQSQAVYDLWLEQGSVPMPFSDRRGKGYESAARRKYFRPVGDQWSCEYGHAQQKQTSIQRSTTGRFRCCSTKQSDCVRWHAEGIK